MTVNEAYLIYFSPTHTSKQIAEAIVQGAGIKNIFPINVTQQAAEEVVIPTSALAIVVVPVYGGHVAPLAMNVYGTFVVWMLLRCWWRSMEIGLMKRL